MINRFSCLSWISMFCLGFVLVAATAFPKNNVSQQDLNRMIAAQSDTHLAFLQKLSAATKDGEEAVQALVAQRLKALGCRVQTLRISPSDIKLKHEFADLGELAKEPRISVVGRYSGQKQGRSLLIFAHPDPPPQEGLEKWTFDPFQERLKRAKSMAGVWLMIWRGLRS